MTADLGAFVAACRRFRARHVVALLVMALLSSGCATMFSGTHQIFLLRSDNPNTAFSVDDRDLGTGVATVPLAKKALRRTVFGATAPGCAPVSSRIETKLDGVWFASAIYFPIMPITMVVDVLTGSFRMAKRTVFVLNPKCPGPPPAV